MVGPVVTSVTPTVHLVEGPAVNWVVLTDGPPGPGTAYTLVDAGYPGYVDLVRASLAGLGLQPDGLAAVLVTHAHVDHVGGLPGLIAERPVPVHTSETEVRHAHGELSESAGPKDLLPRIHQHGMLPWALHITRNGAAGHVTVPSATGVPDDVALDLPGRPVPFTTPGHTSGHTCWHLPDQGVVITGDALCTGHALARRTEPQVLRAFFQHDTAAMLASLDTIGAVDADVVLPGHGPVHNGPVKDAADTAREGARKALAGR